MKNRHFFNFFRNIFSIFNKEFTWSNTFNILSTSFTNIRERIWKNFIKYNPPYLDNPASLHISSDDLQLGNNQTGTITTDAKNLNVNSKANFTQEFTASGKFNVTSDNITIGNNASSVTINASETSFNTGDTTFTGNLGVRGNVTATNVTVNGLLVTETSSVTSVLTYEDGSNWDYVYGPNYDNDGEYVLHLNKDTGNLFIKGDISTSNLSVDTENGVVDGLSNVAITGSYNDLTDKPTIPTVPTSNTAFTNDAGYITSASTVFNNYYTKTEGDGKYATQNMLNNSVNYLQTQINNLIDAYSECCTAMTLSGTAIINTTSTTQLVDIGPWREIEVFASSAKTVYPAAAGNDTFSLGVKGQVPCTFKLIDGITSLGAIGDGWHSIFALKYQFNGGFTKIAQDCFTGSTSLQVLDFPSTLTEIRDRAFDGCTALKSLIFRSATPPTLYTPGQTNALDTLYSVNTSFKIYVPSANVNAYKAATGWSTYANLIQAIP